MPHFIVLLRNRIFFKQIEGLWQPAPFFFFQQHVQIFVSASHFGNSCLYSKTPPAKAQDDG